MQCPQCSRIYERNKDFDRGESFFECETCEVELVLSKEERLYGQMMQARSESHAVREETVASKGDEMPAPASVSWWSSRIGLAAKVVFCISFAFFWYLWRLNLYVRMADRADPIGFVAGVIGVLLFSAAVTCCAVIVLRWFWPK